MTAYQPNQNTQRSPLGHLEGDTAVGGIYKNGDMNLTEIADKILEEMHEDDEDIEPQEPRVRKLFYTTLILGIVGGFAALAYYAYQFGNKPVDTSLLQVVKADNTAYKEKPEDPGGMEVPNMDKTVYDSIAGKQDKALPKVERILPPPEEPINPNGVVYETAADKPLADKPAAESKSQQKPQAKSQQTVTNSREALLANKAMAGKELKPVVVKAPEAEATPEVVTAEPAQELEEVKTPPAVEAKTSSPKLKPVSEADLKTAPEKSKIEQPVALPRKAASARYKVQLGAYRSEEDAVKDWTRLNKLHPDELKSLQYFIERKDLGAKGIFYRLQAGPFDDSAAARLTCSKLVANNQGCFFVEAR